MFQHSGTQPWLSSTICCNTLSNLLYFLRTVNKGSKKCSSFIDTINNTMVSNTSPDGNCLSPEQQERGEFAEMLLDSQRLGQ